MDPVGLASLAVGHVSLWGMAYVPRRNRSRGNPRMMEPKVLKFNSMIW